MAKPEVNLRRCQIWSEETAASAQRVHQYLSIRADKEAMDELFETDIRYRMTQDAASRCTQSTHARAGRKAQQYSQKAEHEFSTALEAVIQARKIANGLYQQWTRHP